MTPITAVTAIRVVRPEISIIQRTRATIFAAAGSRGFSSSASGSLMGPDHRTETVVVADADTGARLDRMLAAQLEGLSRSRIKALILAGEVAVGGRTIRDPEHRVNAGDSVAITVPPPTPAAPKPESIPLDIVFEDDQIIVIDKAKGLVVHPAPGAPSGASPTWGNDRRPPGQRSPDKARKSASIPTMVRPVAAAESAA